MSSNEEKILKLQSKVVELESLLEHHQTKTRSKLNYLLGEIHKLGGGRQAKTKENSKQKCKKGSCGCEK